MIMSIGRSPVKAVQNFFRMSLMMTDVLFFLPGTVNASPFLYRWVMYHLSGVKHMAFHTFLVQVYLILYHYRDKKGGEEKKDGIVSFEWETESLFSVT